MPKSRRSVWIYVTGIACLAPGCMTPSLNQGADKGQPTLGAKPGPLKQIATSIGDTKVGQSVSKAFTRSPKAKEDPSDPVSLKSKVKPFTAETYVKLGKVAEESNDIEGAREAYHKALKMKPHHLGALVGLGRVFERQGQLGRAAEHYLEATQFHSNDASAFNDLGFCYLRQGRNDDALFAFKRAVELEPDRALYRNNIATVLVRLKRYDEALAQLTDAHGEAVAHYNLGCMLHAEHRDPLALEHFQLAIQRQPSFVEARQWAEALSAAPPPDGQVAVAMTNSGAAAESVVLDNEPAPAVAGMATPEIEPLPPVKDSVRRSTHHDAVATQPTVDETDVEMVAISDGETSDRVDQPGNQPDPSLAEAEPRADQSELEARLQLLPPVDQKYRAPSRY